MKKLTVFAGTSAERWQKELLKRIALWSVEIGHVMVMESDFDGNNNNILVVVVNGGRCDFCDEKSEKSSLK